MPFGSKIGTVVLERPVACSFQSKIIYAGLGHFQILHDQLVGTVGDLHVAACLLRMMSKKIGQIFGRGDKPDRQMIDTILKIADDVDIGVMVEGEMIVTGTAPQHIPASSAI